MQSHAADDAYAEVLELEGEDNPWLLERRVQPVAPAEGVPMGH